MSAMSTTPLRRTDEPPRVLRLPDISDRHIPGARFIGRAVGWTIAIIVLVAVSGIAVMMSTTIRRTVQADGVVVPGELWPVRVARAGILTSVKVRTGERVSRGDQIAVVDTIDNTERVTELTSRLIELRAIGQREEAGHLLDGKIAAARLDQAQAQVARAHATTRQRLTDFGFGTNLDSLRRHYRSGNHIGLDLAWADVLAAEADVRLAEAERGRHAMFAIDRDRRRAEEQNIVAQLALARARHRAAFIEAPADGIVITEQIEKSLGSAVREGDVLMQIADTTAWQLVVSVNEKDVHQIRTADSAIVDLPALTNQARDSFRGIVRSIAAEPEATAGVGASLDGAVVRSAGRYRVVVELSFASDDASRARSSMRGGYRAQVRIVTRSANGFALFSEYVRDWIRPRG
jgi:multidrug resistance efflux pump